MGQCDVTRCAPDDDDVCVARVAYQLVHVLARNAVSVKHVAETNTKVS